MNNVKTLVAAVAMAFTGAASAADPGVDLVAQTVQMGDNTNVGYGNTSFGFQNTLNGSTLGVVIGRQIDVAAGLQDVIHIGNIGGTQSNGTIGLGTFTFFGPNADFSVASGAGSNGYALRGASYGYSSSVLAGATDSAAIGSFSVADQARTVSVGNPTLLRRVTYVDTPVNSADAANKAYVDNAVASVSTAGMDELKGRVNGLENRINEVDRKVSGGVAIAMAVAAPVSLAPGESAMSVGSGYFGGQGAIAVSYAHSVKLDGTRQREKNELGEVIEDVPESELTKPWIFKEAIFSAGLGSSTNGDVGVRASMTFKW